MTATPTPPAVGRSLPIRRSPGTARTRSARLLAALEAEGLHGREVTEWVAGEPDVRVQVWHDRWLVTAELLRPDPDGGFPDRVDAVRVWREDRTLWRNPSGRWAEGDCVRFVADLLVLPPSLLRRRYLLLG